MRAAILENGQIRVGDMPDPTPKQGQVLVRTHRCALCASDAHFLCSGEQVVARDRELGGPYAGVDLSKPIVMGHEFVGEIIDYVCEAHRNLLGHSHQVTTVIIDLDGDRASSEAYYFASMRMQAGGQLKQLYVWGRYLDQWSRRNGRWGIDKRVALIDFDEIRDVAPLSATQLRRDRSDPSYAILQHYPRPA